MQKHTVQQAASPPRQRHLAQRARQEGVAPEQAAHCLAHPIHLRKELEILLRIHFACNPMITELEGSQPSRGLVDPHPTMACSPLQTGHGAWWIGTSQLMHAHAWQRDQAALLCWRHVWQSPAWAIVLMVMTPSTLSGRYAAAA